MGNYKGSCSTACAGNSGSSCSGGCKKVAEYFVRGNAESLHVKVFVRILVIGDSVMVVVLVHVNHLVRILVLHV